MTLKVFAWSGELFGAESRDEVLRIADDNGCLSSQQMKEPIVECPSAVRVLDGGTTWRTCSAASLVADGFGGWLTAGEPA